MHARHGPIDLIVAVRCEKVEDTRRCEAAAIEAFADVLETLVAELPALRRIPAVPPHRLRGSVARRMSAAVGPYAGYRVGAMAAVAGAVADHVLAAMLAVGTLRCASVNNGGDVALHLAAGESLRVGICADPRSARPSARILVPGGAGVGGVATSGWRGRSHSLGIADAVTAFAPSAAAADAAATLIANAVDLPGVAEVRRVPAAELAPESELGERLVTVDVAPLDAASRARALAPGVSLARQLIERRLVSGVRLELQGSVVVESAGPGLANGSVDARGCATRAAHGKAVARGGRTGARI